LGVNERGGAKRPSSGGSAIDIGAIFSTALVVNGIVYIGSNDGCLYAVE
jgi:hypothetical protein